MVLMVALVQQKKWLKSISISFSKAKFCLSLHYNGDTVNICKFKANDN